MFKLANDTTLSGYLISDENAKRLEVDLNKMRE